MANKHIRRRSISFVIKKIYFKNCNDVPFYFQRSVNIKMPTNTKCGQGRGPTDTWLEKVCHFKTQRGLVLQN